MFLFYVSVVSQVVRSSASPLCLKIRHPSLEKTLDPPLDTTIGSDVFSQEKFRLKFVFGGLTFDFFHVLFIFIEKRKVNSTMEQKKCESHEKCDRLLVSNVEPYLQISQLSKSLTEGSNVLKLG